VLRLLRVDSKTRFLTCTIHVPPPCNAVGHLLLMRDLDWGWVVGVFSRVIAPEAVRNVARGAWRRRSVTFLFLPLHQVRRRLVLTRLRQSWNVRQFGQNMMQLLFNLD